VTWRYIAFSFCFQINLRRYIEADLAAAGVQGTVRRFEVGWCKVDPSFTPDVYRYRARCIRLWGHDRTDVGSNLYGYRVRCGGAG